MKIRDRQTLRGERTVCRATKVLDQRIRVLRCAVALSAAFVAIGLLGGTTAKAAQPQTATLGVAGDGNPDFLYDPATGDLRFVFNGFVPLDTDDNPSFFDSVQITSASKQLLFKNTTADFQSGIALKRTTSVLQTAFTDPPGIYDNFDIGQVLAPNLSSSALLSDLTLKFQVLDGGNLQLAGLIIQSLQSPINVYSGPSGNWSTPNNWTLGHSGLNGEGVIISPPGTGPTTVNFDANVNSLSTLTLDSTSGGSVIFRQPQGTLGVSANVVVGVTGAATFTQTGGTHTVGAGLIIAGGSTSTSIYNLSAGSVVVAGDETVGSRGSGTFNQSGGSNSINGSLIVGNSATGVFNLSGQSVLSVAQSEYVGLYGSGTFTQTGGTHIVNAANIVGNILIIGVGVGSGNSTYNMLGGTLLVNGPLNVGLVQPATFNLNGGTVNVQYLNVGPKGKLNLVSGTLISPGQIQFSNQASVNLANTSLSGAVANDGQMNFTGGTNTVGALSGAGTLDIGNASGATALASVGSLAQAAALVDSTGTLQLAQGSARSTATLSTLAINAGGKVDLTANNLVLSSTPVSAVKNWVASARSGGSWSGAGITSAIAMADPVHYAVGYADGASGVVSGLTAGNVLVESAPVGDVSLTGSVTAGSIQQIVGRGQFNSGHAASWVDGDVNGDGIVSSADLRLIALSGNYSNGAQPAATHGQAIPVGVPTLNYNPLTGDVTLVTNGVNNIADLHLLSASNKFIAANTKFTSFVTAGGSELESTLFGSYFGDGYDLGNILPIGLTATAVQSDVSTFYSASGGGTEQRANLVPEPMSGALLGIGAMGLLARRRKSVRAGQGD